MTSTIEVAVQELCSHMQYERPLKSEWLVKASDNKDPSFPTYCAHQRLCSLGSAGNKPSGDLDLIRPCNTSLPRGVRACPVSAAARTGTLVSHASLQGLLPALFHMQTPAGALLCCRPNQMVPNVTRVAARNICLRAQKRLWGRGEGLIQVPISTDACPPLVLQVTSSPAIFNPRRPPGHAFLPLVVRNCPDSAAAGALVSHASLWSLLPALFHMTPAAALLCRRLDEVVANFTEVVGQNICLHGAVNLSERGKGLISRCPPPPMPPPPWLCRLPALRRS